MRHASGGLATRDGLYVEQLADPLDERFYIERLFEEVISASIAQLLNLFLFDHSGDANDPHIVHGSVAANQLANFLAVDVWQHDVENDQVRPKLLDHHAGAETVIDAANFESAVAFQVIDDELDEILIVINDQHFPLAAVKRIGRDTVVAHERVQLISRDTAETAARNAEALQLTGIKAANDGLLTDFADFGGFAGRKHSFHALNHLSP
jgi:hypothetical protein